MILCFTASPVGQNRSYYACCMLKTKTYLVSVLSHDFLLLIILPVIVLLHDSTAIYLDALAAQLIGGNIV